MEQASFSANTIPFGSWTLTIALLKRDGRLNPSDLLSYWRDVQSKLVNQAADYIISEPGNPQLMDAATTLLAWNFIIPADLRRSRVPVPSVIAKPIVPPSCLRSWQLIFLRMLRHLRPKRGAGQPKLKPARRRSLTMMN